MTPETQSILDEEKKKATAVLAALQVSLETLDDFPCAQRAHGVYHIAEAMKKDLDLLAFFVESYVLLHEAENHPLMHQSLLSTCERVRTLIGALK